MRPVSSPARPLVRPQSTRPRLRRRGSVLVLVLVVVVLLTLAAANYSAWMTTELEATTIAASDIQARCLADSGAEYVATLITNRDSDASANLQANPDLFLGIAVGESKNARGQGRFTIIAPLEQDETATRIRYGLIDESGKLNLNLLDKLNLDDDQSRALLMGLPGMTEDIADAIRDWIDADDTTRLYGAESEYYESQSPAYSAKNGPLETIDELLLIRGVTPELLYGEDANRNGLLDPNEDDGEARPPSDNADGLLQLGWSAYLTTVSRESNLRADGTLKIDINNGILTDVYDQLEEEFGADVALFVVCFRMAGPKDKAPGSDSDSSGSGASGGGGSGGSGSGGSGQNGSGSGGGNNGSGNSGGNGSGGSGGNSGGGNDAAAGAGALATLLGGSGAVTRGPSGREVDLSKGATYTLKSLWELLGPEARCDVTFKGAQNSTTLDSPWADPGTFTNMLPDILDALSVTSEDYIEGRVNINQARREVLIGLPNINENIISAILSAQPVDATGQPVADVISQQGTTGWLYSQGLVDIWGMRALDPFITAKGDVYRAQILGFFEGGGPVSRIEVVVDGTQMPPRVVFHRDLDELGRGYTRQQIFPTDE